MLVPETVGGLWKQRVRWAQGGHEVLLRDFWATMKSKKLSLYILMFEQIISITWVYIILLYLAFLLMTANFLDYTYLKYSFSIFPFIIYDDIYQHYSVYSCFIYRQSLRKEKYSWFNFCELVSNSLLDYQRCRCHFRVS